jgi:hypothetical protein
MDISSCIQEIQAVYSHLDNCGRVSLEEDNFSTVLRNEKFDFDLLSMDNVVKVKSMSVLSLDLLHIWM